MSENKQHRPTCDELITEFKTDIDAYMKKYAAPLRPEGFELARQKVAEEMKIRPFRRLGEACRRLFKQEDQS